MRLLIDSYAFLWWSESSTQLGIAAWQAIAHPANDVLISIAALWEIVIKTSSGKLTLPADIETMVLNQGFSIFPINFDHLRRIEGMPRIHNDPFDRMMIAQARAEGIPIATANRRFPGYGVQIVR